jgi:beta-glucanase (GH16 family)
MPAGQGRSVARLAVAGAMIVAVAALGLVLVPSGDNTDLDTSGAELPAVEAAATTGAEQLLAYDATTGGGGPGGATATSLPPDPAQAAGNGAADTSSMVTAAGAAPANPVAGPVGASPSAPATAAGPSVTRAAGATPTSAPQTTAPQTTAKPATTAAPASTAPGGGCWNLAMQDDFNGSSVDTSKWNTYDSPGNSGHGLRRTSAISVSGGMLDITAQMVNGTLVSGGMGSRHNQTYGRYEFRVRTDQDPSEAISGLVLTWPQSNVHPRDGENDLYETLGKPGDRHEFYTFIHKPNGSQTDQEYVIHGANATDWHTMAAEWGPSEMKIYRDGVLVKTIAETSANLIPDVPHFVAIQLDAWQDTMGGPVSMQVDYLKVFSAC